MMHTLQMIVINLLNLTLMFYLFSLVLNNQDLLYSFGFTENSNFVSLMIFIKIYDLLAFVLRVLTFGYIRKLEFQADEFAAKKGYKNELCSSLLKIHTHNASNLCPDPLYAMFNFNHPELLERLKALGFDHHNEGYQKLDDESSKPINESTQKVFDNEFSNVQ